MVVEDNAQETGAKQESTIITVDLNNAELSTAPITVDPESDAFDRGVIMPAGIYKCKPFLDAEGFKMDKETGHYFCGLEWKVLECTTNPELTKEYEGVIVQGGASTVIKKGKKTNIMGTILAKFGAKVERVQDTKQLAIAFSKWMSKEPVTYIVVDWKSSHKDDNTDKWVNDYWTMAEFPKNEDGSFSQEGINKQGHRYRAQLWVSRVIGPTLDGFDMDLPGVVAKPGQAKANAPKVTTGATVTTTAKPTTTTTATAKATPAKAAEPTIDDLGDFFKS